MEKLLELLQQINDLSGVAIEGITNAMEGKEKGSNPDAGGPPPGGGAPAPDGGGQPPAGPPK